MNGFFWNWKFQSFGNVYAIYKFEFINPLELKIVDHRVDPLELKIPSVVLKCFSWRFLENPLELKSSSKPEWELSCRKCAWHKVPTTDGSVEWASNSPGRLRVNKSLVDNNFRAVFEDFIIKVRYGCSFDSQYLLYCQYRSKRCGIVICVVGRKTKSQSSQYLWKIWLIEESSKYGKEEVMWIKGFAMSNEEGVDFKFACCWLIADSWVVFWL